MKKCTCCKSKDISFDNMVLYVNFNHGLPTIQYLFDKFVKTENINVLDIDIAFCYPTYIELQKYGQHNKLCNIEWLNTLGINRINTYTDLTKFEDDLVRLFNYAVNTSSVCIFIGDMTDWMKREYDLLVSRKPIILLTPDFEVKSVWVGRPDSNHNYYLDNQS